MALCKNCLEPISEKEQENQLTCSVCGASLHAYCTSPKEIIKCDECILKNISEEKNDSEEIKIPETIRRSYIDTYKQCPYKFYMEVIKGFEQPPTIYTQLGIDVHDLLDKASNDKSITEKDMWLEFLEKWDNYDSVLFDSPEQKDTMFERAKNSIHNGFKYIQGLGAPHCTEQKMTFKISDDLPMISATADRVDIKGNALHVIDWKTGKPLTGQKLSSDIQAPLYIYAIENHFDKKVESFTFAYLNNNATRVFERINDDRFVCAVKKNRYEISLQETISLVTKILTKIKNNNFNVPNHNQSMYFTCKMCHLREKGMCEGALMQSWKTN